MPLERIAIVAAGVAFLIVAYAWRRASVEAASKRLGSALADPDPAIRRAAVHVAASHGLARNAGLIIRCLSAERDAAVLRAAVEAIARSEWEPSDNEQVIDLRLWARRRLDARRTRTDRSDARSEPVAIAPVLSIAPESSEADATDRLAVLVTGAGGPAGVAVIRALKTAGHRVVAADADRLAAGSRLADDSALLPAFDDPSLAVAIRDVARRTGATALISTIAEEMLALTTSLDDFEADGLDVWLPSFHALQTCIDKWFFAQTLLTAEIAAPPTGLGNGEGVPGPWVVKPRRGRGSRDVVFADDADDLRAALRRVPDPIVQTRLRGNEFTVDALVDRHGLLVCAVPRWRIETKAGISVKGRTFVDETLEEALVPLMSVIGLRGAACVQGFIDDDGRVSFLEVNPRFSGGLPLSLAAGADLVGEYLRGVRGLGIRHERLKWRPDVTMIRHFEEVFEG